MSINALIQLLIVYSHLTCPQKAKTAEPYIQPAAQTCSLSITEEKQRYEVWSLAIYSFAHTTVFQTLKQPSVCQSSNLEMSDVTYESRHLHCCQDESLQKYSYMYFDVDVLVMLPLPMVQVKDRSGQCNILLYS